MWGVLNWNAQKVRNLSGTEIWLFIVARVLIGFGLQGETRIANPKSKNQNPKCMDEQTFKQRTKRFGFAVIKVDQDIAKSQPACSLEILDCRFSTFF